MTAGAEPDAAYLDYRLRWRAEAARPGKHPARNSGGGGDFRAIRPFWQLPDARRIDIRRSIVDPFGEVMVRETEQRSAITIALAVDVSRSMHPAAARSTLPAIARLASAAAQSALRAGDAFACIAFDRTIRRDLSLPPSRLRAAARDIAAALAGATLSGRGAEGILDLAAELPTRRCLVLLVSDFAMQLELIEAALTALARHDVAPVVLRADAAVSLPRAGLLRLRDAETGRPRLLLLRPSLRRRWEAAEVRRRAQLDALFERHGRSGFYAGPSLSIGTLSDHLLDR